MATVMLSILIFGFAGYIVFNRLRGKGGCSDCHCDCSAASEKK